MTASTAPGTRPRLSVGIISAGAVGTAVGEALHRAGHTVTGVVARSESSSARARERLPEAVPGSIGSTVAGADLIVLAVPDPALRGVADRVARALAESRRDGTGTIVLHTAGSMGLEPLSSVAALGATVIAAHPAMTFIGRPRDTDKLTDGCPWGVTAADEIGDTVAELLIGEMGGRVTPVPNESRTLYHAAMAHGSNHVGAIVADAVELLTGALGGRNPDETPSSAAVLLGPILHASVDNALNGGKSAITGPAARDDAETVGKHLDVIRDHRPDIAEPYLAMALRVAGMRDSRAVLDRFSR